MNSLAELEQFWERLAAVWPHPTTVYLTGGAAALVLGGARPTRDIDFEVQFHSPRPNWEAFASAVDAVSQATGIGAQYAESIDRWSQVTFLDYREHTRPVRRFGQLEVRVLDLLHWSIGKISRFYDQDAQDLIAVFKRHRPDPLKVATLWERALRASPKSTQLRPTREQALYFFRTHGRRIWGKQFSLEAVEAVFSPA